jgi:hypothetical protein
LRLLTNIFAAVNGAVPPVLWRLKGTYTLAHFDVFLSAYRGTKPDRVEQRSQVGGEGHRLIVDVVWSCSGALQ